MDNTILEIKHIKGHLLILCQSRSTLHIYF